MATHDRDERAQHVDGKGVRVYLEQLLCPASALPPGVDLADYVRDVIPASLVRPAEQHHLAAPSTHAAEGQRNSAQAMFLLQRGSSASSTVRGARLVRVVQRILLEPLVHLPHAHRPVDDVGKRVEKPCCARAAAECRLQEGRCSSRRHGRETGGRRAGLQSRRKRGQSLVKSRRTALGLRDPQRPSAPCCAGASAGRRVSGQGTRRVHLVRGEGRGVST